MARKGANNRPTDRSRGEARDQADRTAAGINPAAKAATLLQLRRARGQVEGIERMIEANRYCVDVIVQITAARASLLRVAKSLLSEHLRSCRDAAMRDGGIEADDMYQELVELVSRMSR